MLALDCRGGSERQRYRFRARLKNCVGRVVARCRVSSQVGSVIVDDVVVKCSSSVSSDVLSSEPVGHWCSGSTAAPTDEDITAPSFLITFAA